MVRGPQIRTKQPARDSSLRGLLYTNGEIRTWPLRSLQNCVKVGVVASKRGSKPRNIGDKRTVICHASSMGPMPRERKGCPYGQSSYSAEDFPMADIWVQRPTFQAEVKAYRLREKVKLSDLAPLLGLEEATLKDYLYRKDVKPSLEVLQRASGLFKVSVTQFIDDPGAPIAGQDLSEESEDTRYFAKMIVKGVGSKDLTDGQKAFIMQDIMRAIERASYLAPPVSSRAAEDHPGYKSDGEPGVTRLVPRRTPRPKR